MSEKVFMDIGIGHEDHFANESRKYELAKAFYQQTATQFGLDPELSAIESLDDETKQLLIDSFNSQAKWKQQGEIHFNKPESLLAGRIVIELFPKDAPKAAENFKALCTGEKGNCKSNREKPLHYKGCAFHRIIKGFMCQGGDITFGDGRGGESIYGKKFVDEKGGLALHHAAGVVSMANSGKNSNTSQFFFTFADKPSLDKKHVVFGKIIEGMDVLQQIEDRAASDTGVPVIPVKILDCGVSL